MSETSDKYEEIVLRLLNSQTELIEMVKREAGDKKYILEKLDENKISLINLMVYLMDTRKELENIKKEFRAHTLNHNGEKKG